MNLKIIFSARSSRRPFIAWRRAWRHAGCWRSVVQLLFAELGGGERGDELGELGELGGERGDELG